jgi:chaperonin cofactor prefoldin
MSAQSMQAMTANMQSLKQSAESGNFAISRAGAEAYIKAIDDAQFSLNDLDTKIAVVRQETKLGTSPDGQALSRYNLEGAVGGAGTAGIIPAIEQLKAALEEAKTAMVKAVENYQAADDDHAGNMKRI